MRDYDVKGPHIVFQPRLWSKTSGSGDEFDIANADRIATVRVLREAITEEHAVGLLRNTPAFEMVPYLVLSDRVPIKK